MRPKLLLALVFALCVFAAPASAEQIIHFTNGTSMPIRSYEVSKGMIHVDLGGDAFIAFPFSMVEKIVDAGKEIVLDPSTPGANNVMKVSGGPDGSFPVRGQAPPERRSIPDGLDRTKTTPVEVDPKSGLATVRPFGAGAQAGKQRMSVAGNRSLMGGGGGAEGTYRGTTPVGNRHVIGPLGPPGRRRSVQVTTMQPTPNAGGTQVRGSQNSNGSNPGSSGSESSEAGDSGSGDSGSGDSGSGN